MKNSNDKNKSNKVLSKLFGEKNSFLGVFSLFCAEKRKNRRFLINFAAIFSI
jgi:hypothetical protein